MKKRILIAVLVALCVAAVAYLLPNILSQPGDLPTSTGSTPVTKPTLGTTLPTTQPTIPTTAPTIPTTLPTIPTTAPTIPTTLPTIPSTIPTTIPTVPTTVPTIPTTLPTIPTTLPTIPTTLPTVPTTEPTTEPTTTVPPTTTQPPRPGQVRFYSCNEAMLEKLVSLSVEYYTNTGVEVILMTPAEGETCQQALERYMMEEYAPTVFCIHTESDFYRYAYTLYELSGTTVANQLSSGDFGMYAEDHLLAIPVEVDWFGYIFNAEKLSIAGFSREEAFFRKDMSSYNAMSYIAAFLSKPFGTPNLSVSTDDGLSSLLATVFSDPAELRAFLDLQTGRHLSGNDPLPSFKNGKTIFYAGTTADFENVLSMGINNLDLLPAFTPDNSAMHYTCNHFWGVNQIVYAPDLTETLAFLAWMVTAQNGSSAPIDSLGMLSPYQDAVYAKNALEKLLRSYMQQEPALLVWEERCVDDEDMTDFCAAMVTYFLKPNDANWEEVKKYMC